MPKETISKISLFVILTPFLLSILISCHSDILSLGTGPAFDKGNAAFSEPKVVGRLESTDITESSGLVVSQCQQNVLWTHNDSGDGPFIFAMDATGKSLGTWRIPNAKNHDWEDIAEFRDRDGKCLLYIAETGNTSNNERAEHQIYRIGEPVVHDADSSTTRKEPIQTEPAKILTFSYPDERQDAETLMVHPLSGEIYIVTKHRTTPASVYKLKPDFDLAGPTLPEKITTLTVPSIPNGFLTGGDIAADGKHMIICDYFAAYEFVLPDGAGSFDEIWKQKPTVVDLGKRQQGEAIAYSPDGLSVFATSEGKSSPLTKVNRLPH